MDAQALRYTWGRDELGADTDEDAPALLCEECRMPVEYSFCPACGEPEGIHAIYLSAMVEERDALMSESARLLDEREEDQRGGDPILCAECESGLRELYPHTYREGCGEKVRELFRSAAVDASHIAGLMLRMLRTHQSLIDELTPAELHEMGSDPFVTVYPFALSLDDLQAEVGVWAELLGHRGDGLRI